MTSVRLGRARQRDWLGGLVLDLMPCVLPVLGLKLMAVLRHHGRAHNGGRSIATADLSGGSEDVEGGTAIGTLVENGGSLCIPGAGSILGRLMASIVANNVLSIQGLTGGPMFLMLDPTADHSGDTFKLASDGHGGMNLTIQAASGASAPTLDSLRTAASVQGDPLGRQATFTKTVPGAASPAAASGTTLPDIVGGSSQAFAPLMQAGSSAHAIRV